MGGCVYNWRAPCTWFEWKKVVLQNRERAVFATTQPCGLVSRAWTPGCCISPRFSWFCNWFHQFYSRWKNYRTPKWCSANFEATDILQFSCYADVAWQQMKPNPSSIRICACKKFYWSRPFFIDFWMFPSADFQNAITSDTCDADTSNKISAELGYTGHIWLYLFLTGIEHCIDWHNVLEPWKQSKIRKKSRTDKRKKRCL